MPYQPVSADPADPAPPRESRPLHRIAAQGVTLLKDSFTGYIDDHALTRGAAIAFYAVTALAPVLFIAGGIASLAFGQDAASGAIHYQLRRIMSDESADLLQSAILHVRYGDASFLSGALSALALVITASGVFTEIEDTLNVIWRAPRNESYLYQMMRGRVLSLGMVVVLGLLLMSSMTVAAGVSVLARYLDRATSLSSLMVDGINFGLSFGLAALTFAAVFKLLPNRRLLWGDVWPGALVTALLFQLGQLLIGFYLANFMSAKAYGAAGGVIVLLVWIYYIAQAFLLGAEFTRAWARRHGSLKPRR